VQAEAINRKVGQWLDGRAAASPRPFFLWVHYMDMHEPYVPAQKYVDAVDPSVRMSAQEMFGLFRNTLLARDVSDPGKVELLRKLYLANVRKVDDCVRELFGILEGHGVLGNSTVILTSDHGDEFGEHGGLSHDGRMYSELLHVPLMILDGAGSGGGVVDDLVSSADLPPTILRLFGLPAEERFQGRALPPGGASAARCCFSEAIGKKGRRKETDRPVYCCREGHLKISYRVEGDQWELLDLSSDPAEKRNLMGASPRAEEMKARLAPRLDRRGARQAGSRHGS
jgi:arylsulfatase A-like enzyme